MFNREEFTEILRTKIGLTLDESTPDTTATLAELGVDSLAVLELQTVLKQEYQVEVPDDAAGLTVDQLHDTLCRQFAGPV
jgi:aromatase